jgi:hypothetical protein
MGPQRGDPMCYCQMKAAGLTPTGPSDAEKAALTEALSRYCATDAEKADHKPV